MQLGVCSPGAPRPRPGPDMGCHPFCALRAGLLVGADCAYHAEAPLGRPTSWLLRVVVTPVVTQRALLGAGRAVPAHRRPRLGQGRTAGAAQPHSAGSAAAADPRPASGGPRSSTRAARPQAGWPRPPPVERASSTRSWRSSCTLGTRGTIGRARGFSSSRPLTRSRSP